MCLGIPGRVLEIWGHDSLLTGRVDFAGSVKEVCLAYTPEVRVGEYVIVHVGFAISQVDEAEARKTLEIMAQIPGLLQQELESTAAAAEAAPEVRQE